MQIREVFEGRRIEDRNVGSKKIRVQNARIWIESVYGGRILSVVLRQS